MTSMIQRFIDNIDPYQKLFVDGREYQYNTTDSDGWTYWKELGKGNDLGLKLIDIKSIGNLGSDYLLVTFHTGRNILIPQAEHDHPLITIGV